MYTSWYSCLNTYLSVNEFNSIKQRFPISITHVGTAEGVQPWDLFKMLLMIHVYVDVQKLEGQIHDAK